MTGRFVCGVWRHRDGAVALQLDRVFCAIFACNLQRDRGRMVAPQCSRACANKSVSAPTVQREGAGRCRGNGYLTRKTSLRLCSLCFSGSRGIQDSRRTCAGSGCDWRVRRAVQEHCACWHPLPYTTGRRCRHRGGSVRTILPHTRRHWQECTFIDVTVWCFASGVWSALPRCGVQQANTADEGYTYAHSRYRYRAANRAGS